MVQFNLVVFGITSNLAQLKIIPALYDLETKSLLDADTKITGIGRKDIDIKAFVEDVLVTPNRHHQHVIDKEIAQRLISRFDYLREDIEKGSGDLYRKLTLQKGNTLFYLATYPNLYEGIFDNLKKYGLTRSNGGWIKIMIEKPIGHDLESCRNLNKLLSIYFDQKDIFRVDHYLGKQDLQDVFKEAVDPVGIDSIQISILEDFSIGKRGVYYDATGALIDMGQNHFMQMLSAVAKEDLTVEAREKVIGSLVPEPENLLLGQYEGYLNEENIKAGSTTDTFFALRTHLSQGLFKDIPIYMRSGKHLYKSEIKISVVYKDGKIKSWAINSTGVGKSYDPYEKLILEAVEGNQFYFNSAREVELSWRFIDALSELKIKPSIYKQDSDGPEQASNLIEQDGRRWI